MSQHVNVVGWRGATPWPQESRPDSWLALMTTAELQWRVAAQRRMEAPAGELRHAAGQDLLGLVREVERRTGHR